MDQFKLAPLPYPKNALEPYISAETLDFHYGKHHATYVDKLNTLVLGSGFEDAPLEQLIKRASGNLFNNAAQVWNHTFYWNCLTPDGGRKPDGALSEALEGAFSGFSEFKESFSKSASTNFGSGWTWLVKTPSGELEIVNTSNAGNPISDDMQPLLTCDVWEHAYYIDYRNARPKYVSAFWNIVNWDFVARNFLG